MQPARKRDRIRSDGGSPLDELADAWAVRAKVELDADRFEGALEIWIRRSAHGDLLAAEVGRRIEDREAPSEWLPCRVVDEAHVRHHDRADAERTRLRRRVDGEGSRIDRGAGQTEQRVDLGVRETAAPDLRGGARVEDAVATAGHERATGVDQHRSHRDGPRRVGTPRLLDRGLPEDAGPVPHGRAVDMHLPYIYMCGRYMARVRAVSGFGASADRAAKAESGASLLLIDIDNLQVVNEKGGRAMGDAAIAAVMRTLQTRARSEGWTFERVGGDEFALLAPSVPLESAFLRAERLRAELGAALRKAVSSRYGASATIGVANAPRDAKSGDQLMRKADLALYAAKEQGGNVVGLPPADDMVLKSSYYSAAQLARLKALAERKKTKEAVLLREALADVLRKYDRD